MSEQNVIYSNLLLAFPELTTCLPAVKDAVRLLSDCFQGGGKLLLCGNGGSAADCEHIVGELMKGFKLPRALPDDEKARFRDAFPDGVYLAEHLQRGLPAVSLSGALSLNSAFCNDVAADMVFAQSVYGLGRPNDALLAFSTSGNSTNVIQALKVARMRGLFRIGMTGEDGGAMRELCDVCICAPARETYRIQEYHLPLYHAVCAVLEETFFGA